MSQVLVFDPTASDSQSKVRGVGRYLQILKENFPDWKFSSNIKHLTSNIFINPFFNFLQKPLTFKKIAKKQIAVIHDLIPLKYPNHFPAGIRGNVNIFLNKLALKNYDLIITDSYASKKDIVQILKWPEEKVKVIYPCLPRIFTNNNLKTHPPIRRTNVKIASDVVPTTFDVVKTKTKNLKLKKKFLEQNKKFLDLSFELGDKYCLYVGDATWNKNLVNLAKAIKIINVTCVFVGKVFNLRSTFHVTRYTNLHPWQNELKEFLKEAEGDKRFIFAGFVDDYKLIKLYQQAKVNILISRDEGFGFSYLEAASQACPSILSDVPVLKEISQEQGVLLSDYNDPNDIANKIGEVYFNSDLRNKLGFEALKRANFFNQNLFKKQFNGALSYE